MTLRLEGLTVDFGAVRAVEGVSLELAPGSMTAVLGPNGAGKSSLCEAIVGRIGYSGAVHGPGGTRMDGMTTHKRARLGVSLVPQGRELCPGLTIHENLQLPTVRLARDDARAVLAEIYETFPILSEIRERRAGFLSGGERQALAIARALVVKPKVLVLDEPSFGLSPRLRAEIFELVVQQKEAQGLAVLVAEQFVDLALRHADSVIAMSLGKAVWSGTAQEAKWDEIQAIYFGGEHTGKTDS